LGTRSSDPNERAYFWLPGSEATSTHELLDSPVADRLYIDQGEIVRVRVERDEFCDDEPGPPKATEGVLISGEARRLPYMVTVSLRWPPNCATLKVLVYVLRFSALSPSRALGQWRGGRRRRRC
jgi:RNA polymerase III subunit Rpc25